MKVYLVAVNAKYIHSSLALRYLKNSCVCEILEFTINNRKEQVVSDIFSVSPDVLGFSTYIWNISMVLDIVSDLKKILPNTKIILGGPEASFDYENLLRNTNIDAVVVGEGEQSLKALADKNFESFGEIRGVAYLEDGVVKLEPNIQGVHLDSLPFAYAEGFGSLENRIIYYESSRGCPYRCQYCLSSVESGGLRHLSLERAFSDLKVFLDKKIRQVKFVDRTFNCDKTHAIEIWKFLIENDNLFTNFHFEISGSLIDDEMIHILKTARAGLFQFEIGVQSTNGKTLAAIKRPNETQKIFDAVRKIKEGRNIHVHLDLIAGLPFEDLTSFENSFNEVYEKHPEQFQLGFLKLLKGSGLRDSAKEYGIVYSDQAVYEVLYTNDLGYAEICKLKEIEEAVELYYNSGQFINSMGYIEKLYGSHFKMYQEISEFYFDRAKNVAQSKLQNFKTLFEFVAVKFEDHSQLFLELLRFDLCLNENPKSIPEWLRIEITEDDKNILRSHQTRERNSSRIEKFNYSIDSWLNGGKLDKQEIFMLFSYGQETNPIFTGVHAKYRRIEASE